MVWNVADVKGKIITSFLLQSAEKIKRWQPKFASFDYSAALSTVVLLFVELSK